MNKEISRQLKMGVTYHFCKKEMDRLALDKERNNLHFPDYRSRAEFDEDCYFEKRLREHNERVSSLFERVEKRCGREARDILKGRYIEHLTNEELTRRHLLSLATLKRRYIQWEGEMMEDDRAL